MQQTQHSSSPADVPGAAVLGVRSSIRYAPPVRSGRPHKPSKGFTLIELMITVVIIGILAAIAYPAYRDHVIRTHRSAAKACLLEYAQFMERHYTTNLTYVGANPSPGCRNEGSMAQRYLFALGNDVRQRGYTLTATPIGAQLAGDTQCGILGLTQTGERTATGPGGTLSCWQ